MRSSVVATLVFIGLIGLGVRAQTLSGQGESGPRKAHSSAKAAPKGATSFTVRGTWRSTSDAARQDALLRAQEEIKSRLQARYPGLQYAPPLADIDRNLVKGSREERLGDLIQEGKPVEDMDLSKVDELTRDMRKVTLEVEVTDDFLARAAKFDREQHVVGRMADLGRVLAVLVLILAAVAAYIRADEWTRGYYTGWLRTLAVGAVLAGAAAVWWLT
jgi:hypothetical protein